MYATLTADAHDALALTAAQGGRRLGRRLGRWGLLLVVAAQTHTAHRTAERAHTFQGVDARHFCHVHVQQPRGQRRTVRRQRLRERHLADLALARAEGGLGRSLGAFLALCQRRRRATCPGLQQLTEGLNALLFCGEPRKHTCRYIRMQGAAIRSKETDLDAPWVLPVLGVRAVRLGSVGDTYLMLVLQLKSLGRVG